MYYKALGIKYKPSVDGDNLDTAVMASDVILDENLPSFPVDINQPKLIAFINAAYVYDLHKH